MPAGASDRYKELARAPKAEWARLFSRGEQPSFDALEGWEYRVWNARPAILGPLRLRKLLKLFFREPGRRARGCNVPVEQNGLDGPWIARTRRVGFFTVAQGERHRHTLVFDYGIGLRDYVTRVEPGSDDLLFGRAYLGFRRAAVPVIWFLLERHRRAELREEGHEASKIRPS